MKIGIACAYTFKEEKHRSLIHSDNLLEILEQKDTAPLPRTPGTAGTAEDPHRNLSLQDWYYLSQQQTKTAPIYYRVGGRVIARWGSGAGQFQDYTTDITDYQDETAKAVAGGDYEQFVRNLGNAFKSKDQQSGIKPELPSYTRKALRVGDLDDVLAASMCRSLLKDSETSCSACPEIAATFCSLFICEAHRVPATFVISLMLLDLVETRTTYGKGGLKTYTWKSMLMYGVNGSEIPGRGTGVKPLGKHPMAGEGTVVAGNLLFTANSGINLVRDRVISILSVWLTHFLAKKYTKFQYFIIKSDAPHAAWTGKRADRMDQSSNSLKKACKEGVVARCKSTDVLIGGTTVEYQNLTGDTV